MLTTSAAEIVAVTPARQKPDKEWMSRKEAAHYLTKIGCPISWMTLANMASNNNSGKGPSFSRFRWSSVRYHRDDLDKWAKKEMIRVE